MTFTDILKGIGKGMQTLAAPQPISGVPGGEQFYGPSPLERFSRAAQMADVAVAGKQATGYTLPELQQAFSTEDYKRIQQQTMMHAQQREREELEERKKQSAFNMKINQYNAVRSGLVDYRKALEDKALALNPSAKDYDTEKERIQGEYKKTFEIEHGLLGGIGVTPMAGLTGRGLLTTGVEKAFAEGALAAQKDKAYLAVATSNLPDADKIAELAMIDKLGISKYKQKAPEYYDDPKTNARMKKSFVYAPTSKLADKEGFIPIIESAEQIMPVPATTALWTRAEPAPGLPGRLEEVAAPTAKPGVKETLAISKEERAAEKQYTDEAEGRVAAFLRVDKNEIYNMGDVMTKEQVNTALILDKINSARQSVYEPRPGFKQEYMAKLLSQLQGIRNLEIMGPNDVPVIIGTGLYGLAGWLAEQQEAIMKNYERQGVPIAPEQALEQALNTLESQLYYGAEARKKMQRRKIELGMPQIGEIQPQ